MSTPVCTSSLKAETMEEFAFHVSKDYEMFFENCVITPLKQRIENNGNVLADKEFTTQEIEWMKLGRLRDVTYFDIENPKTFMLSVEDRGNIPFSNRIATKDELRGEILRKALDELKLEKPNISLYDALTRLLRNPKRQVSDFCVPIFAKKEFESLDEYIKERFIESLSELSMACMTYIFEGQSWGNSYGVLINSLKKIIKDEERLDGVLFLAFGFCTMSGDNDILDVLKAETQEMGYLSILNTLLSVPGLIKSKITLITNKIL